MFTNIRSFYGVIGVMLFLIALYLVLENYTGASSIITSGSGAATGVFKTLQGR